LGGVDAVPFGCNVGGERSDRIIHAGVQEFDPGAVTGVAVRQHRRDDLPDIGIPWRDGASTTRAASQAGKMTERRSWQCSLGSC